ncbi:hypothetical protein HPB51_022731 [Rhipicephalus microplus]|uniref:Uncharacterized protein n=1 Tax=Rhipicephalus microplus TaxID=6941 RepID=A0A9J6EIJ1_RHIMP|nr:hypothetical protein HPB51_022731 [Rhipicephalus microplus]
MSTAVRTVDTIRNPVFRMTIFRTLQLAVHLHVPKSPTLTSSPKETGLANRRHFRALRALKSICHSRALSTEAAAAASKANHSGYYFELSDEQKEYQNLARKFAREEILPKAAHYDRTGEVRKPIFVLLHEPCFGAFFLRVKTAPFDLHL